MKPFLLLAIRAEDAAADNEYDSFLSLSGLGEGGLRRVRLEQHALGPVDLDDWSGILVGGGPFNYSDPEELKTPVQRRVEADLAGLLDQVVSADFPFLGACYGIGALGRHQDAVVDRRFSEPVGAVEITLTPAGQRDPLLGELPAAFQAFTGHKEAVSRLPGHAVLLASQNALRAGLSEKEAGDLGAALTRVEVYRVLSGELGWSRDRITEVLTNVVRSALLR